MGFSDLFSEVIEWKALKITCLAGTRAPISTGLGQRFLHLMAWYEKFVPHATGVIREPVLDFVLLGYVHWKLLHDSLCEG